MTDKKKLSWLGKKKAQFKRFLLTWQLNNAIKQAERFYKQNRFHYLVLKWRVGFKVIARKDLKAFVAAKAFKKGITIEKLEKSAVYKTY